MLSEDGSGRGAALVAAVVVKDKNKILNEDSLSSSTSGDVLSSS